MLLNELREAIESAGVSRYRISIESGVSQSHLSRFMSGESGCSVENAEKIAEALGLEIVLRPKQRKRGK